MFLECVFSYHGKNCADLIAGHDPEDTVIENTGSASVKVQIALATNTRALTKTETFQPGVFDTVYGMVDQRGPTRTFPTPAMARTLKTFAVTDINLFPKKEIAVAIENPVK